MEFVVSDINLLIISKEEMQDIAIRQIFTKTIDSLNTKYMVSFRFIDINECGLNLDNCHLNATCTNIGGSFFCTCRPGFTGDGISCTGRFFFITKKFY